VSGTWLGAAGGLLWGGGVRLFLSSNMTWSLNSFCHRFGARPYATRDRSTNNAWLALGTLGESWHNNHHAHPSSAAHGLRWWQLDINHASICALELAASSPKSSAPAPGPSLRGTRRRLRAHSSPTVPIVWPAAA
jgi:stearoyl-CoA desaturase (delta-9 desaturase)